MSKLTPVYRTLRQHRNKAVRRLHQTHRQTHRLLKKHGIDLERMRDHAVKTASFAGVATSALVGPAYARTLQNSEPEHSPLEPSAITVVTSPQEKEAFSELAGPDIRLAYQPELFSEKIEQIVPNPGPVLTPEQETAVQDLIQTTYGIPAKAELEGNRLNAVYGVMAGEQHLPVYPGDTLANHSSDPTKELTGMIPQGALPAWGYFAPSKAAVTDQDIQRERYYIAAQTFLAPGWKQNVNRLYTWFKYRKMVMVNPETGSAIVVVIGDAGPSPYLNRTFGGSNEVMIGLDLGLKRKGAVYGFFVDDPEDKIPLGPVTAGGKL